LLLIKKDSAPDGSVNHAVPATKIVIVALAAFAAIFVAANQNSWTRASSNTLEWQLEDELEAGAPLFGDLQASELNDEAEQGNVFVEYETTYGVYTAFQFFTARAPYNDIQNRQRICAQHDTEFDNAGEGLVQGGRVTLGFAITATIISFFAVLTACGSGNDTKAFWLSVIAVCCCVVSLLVWGIIADPILRTRCCPDHCFLGDSYGLVAAGALFLFFGIFYQAWVHSDSTYMSPSAYGLASKMETEMVQA